MKKIVSLLLVLVMAMAMFAGCTNQPEATEPATDPVVTDPATEPAALESEVTFISLSYGETYDSIRSLMLYADESGNAAVDYVGDVKKVGVVNADAFAGVTSALASSGLVELNGAEEYSDGEATASVYVEFADESYISANYAGVIPQAFIDGFNAMDTYFQTVTADLPVYVPEPIVGEGVDADALAAMKEILNGSGMPNLDGLMINNVLPEEFEFSLGLSSSEGIANGTNCSAMMMTTAYSIALVTVEDAANIASVRADFESNIDWRKWICVTPSDALIAQKDNMVICVIGSDEMFTMTDTAVQNAGWTEIKYIENPDM